MIYLVNCPTRWSLYCHLDFCIYHILRVPTLRYVSKSKWQRNIVQRYARVCLECSKPCSLLSILRMSYFLRWTFLALCWIFLQHRLYFRSSLRLQRLLSRVEKHCRRSKKAVIWGHYSLRRGVLLDEPRWLGLGLPTHLTRKRDAKGKIRERKNAPRWRNMGETVQCTQSQHCWQEKWGKECEPGQQHAADVCSVFRFHPCQPVQTA